MNVSITRRSATAGSLLALSTACLSLSVLGKPGTASAETPVIDYSSLDDAKLEEIVHSAQKVLASRAVASDNGVLLCDTDGVEVYLMRKLGTANGGALVVIELAVLNGSDHEVKLCGKPIIINGWDIDGYYGNTTVGAGQNKRIDIDFNPNDAMIESYADVTSIEMGISFRDPENAWGSEELARTDPVTVLFDNGDIVTE